MFAHTIINLLLTNMHVYMYVARLQYIRSV